MTTYDYSNPRNASEAKKLLAALLPKAQARAAATRSSDGDTYLQTGNQVARSVLSSLRGNNLKGVHVYRAPLGGWSADVELKDVPRGMPNILGTPSAHPCRTRDDAVRAITEFLVTILVQEKEQPPEAPEAVRWFMLHDLEIGLNADLVDQLSATDPDFGHQGVHEAIARFVSAEFVDPKRISKEAIEGLPPERRSLLFAMIAVAICMGSFFHPPREAGTPSGHKENANTTH